MDEYTTHRCTKCGGISDIELPCICKRPPVHYFEPMFVKQKDLMLDSFYKVLSSTDNVPKKRKEKSNG
jgi:hypothetical protein